MEPISQHVSLHMIVILVGSAVGEHHGNLRQIILRARCFEAHLSLDVAHERANIIYASTGPISSLLGIPIT